VDEWRADSSGHGVTVRTAEGSYQASRLVIAPGAWAPDLLAGLNIPFDVQRRVMCWFQPLSNPAGFQPENFPIYIWDVDGQNCFYGLGVKAAMHSGAVSCSAENVDRTIHDSDIAEVRGYLEQFIPSLNGPLMKAVSCLYTMSPDQHFVVGIHPNHAQVAVAAGFSGHGFKFTSVMGEILADLAMEGHTNRPIGFLSPARFNKTENTCLNSQL